MKTRRFRPKRKLTRKSTRKHKRHTKRHTKRHYKGGGLFVRNTTKDLVAALVAKYGNVAKRGERISGTDCMYIEELQKLFENSGCKRNTGTVRRAEPAEYETYHPAPEEDDDDGRYAVVKHDGPKTQPAYEEWHPDDPRRNNPFFGQSDA